MKKLIKRLLRKMLSWYVEPLYSQNEELGRRLSVAFQELSKLENKIANGIGNLQDNDNEIAVKIADMNERLENYRTELVQRISDIEDRENWTRNHFEEIYGRVSDIESRENWTRERFEEIYGRVSDIEDRENWIRNRFEEIYGRVSDIESRENWTRERFEEIYGRVSDIEDRENWIRNRFEEVDRRISDIEEREEWTRQRFEKMGKKLKTAQMLNSDGYIGNGEYATLSFAQAGEDVIIAYVLNFLQMEIEDVTYLDIGANHAKELSNTYCFYQAGACGVLVEANPELIPELQRERPRDVVLNRIMDLADNEERDFYVISGDGLSTVSLEEAEKVCEKNPELFIKAQYKVETCTVGQILNEYFPKPPTILSIDIEGMEERILSGIDYAKSSPLVIILENIPYSPLLSIDQREYKCVEFLREKGYTEYAFTGINSIFLLSEAVEKFNKKRWQELAGERR